MQTGSELSPNRTYGESFQIGAIDPIQTFQNVPGFGKGVVLYGVNLSEQIDAQLVQRSHQSDT